MFTYDSSFLPPFAQTFATRPGIHAARIDTPGYFDFVGADLFLSGRRATRRELYEFNRRFVRGPLHAQRRFVRIGFGAHDGPLPGEREITSTDALSPDEAWRAPRGAIVASWGHNDHFGATVRAEEPGYVLFRMTYHPGWRATVDGRPADTVMLSPSFLGIPVTPGAHQVEVRYRPGAWTTVLFYAGLAVLGLVFLGDRARIWPGCDRAGQPGGVRLLAEAALAVALLIALIAVSNVPVDHGAARASHLHTTGAFGHPATACQRAAPRASGRTVQPGPVLAPWHAHRRSAPIGLPSSVFAFDSIG